MTRSFALLLIASGALASCTAYRPASPAGLLGGDYLSRKAWGANPPVLQMGRQGIEFITIHHTATLQQPNRPLVDKLQALQRFSQTESPLASGRIKPAWGDIPYHFYIDFAGKVAEGRQVRFAGDSNTAYDPTGHVLIVLEGNFEEESPTTAQLTSLSRLVGWYAHWWRIPAERIGAHKDYADTLCPGRNLEYYLPWLKQHAWRK